MLFGKVVLVSRSKYLRLVSMLFGRHQEWFEIEFSCWMFRHGSPRDGFYMIASGERAIEINGIFILDSLAISRFRYANKFAFVYLTEQSGVQRSGDL
jgi:hypothetical protein